jgi:type I restriction enzyme, R subunit
MSAQLFAFLIATQPDEYQKLGVVDYKNKQGMARRKFLARLQGEIARRGVIDVLRHGIKYGALSFDLFYGTPSPENAKAVERHRRTGSASPANCATAGRRRSGRWTCAPSSTDCRRHLRTEEQPDQADGRRRRRAIQARPRSAGDAVQFGRCVVHFAVDDHEVAMCTALKGQGHGQGLVVPAVQPGLERRGGQSAEPGRHQDGLPVETHPHPERLTEILENYAQIVEEENPKTRKKKRVQIFPRYHQLDVVRRLLADVAAQGAGQRYLIQHSAGSGKSNSIAWLAHQLIGLRKDGADVFDSIIVVTDRRMLDQTDPRDDQGFCPGRQHHRRGPRGRGQLQDGATVEVPEGRQEDHHLHGADLSPRPRLHRRRAPGRTFAIIIDEAHSSQGGRTAAAMSMVLSESWSGAGG